MKGADALLRLTEWDQFRALDLTRVCKVMRRPVVVDLLNVYKVDDMGRRGFRYHGVVGRGKDQAFQSSSHVDAQVGAIS